MSIAAPQPLRTFDLLFTRDPDQRLCVLLLDAHGQIAARHTLELDLDDPTVAAMRTFDLPDTNAARAFGELLHAAVFDGEVAVRFAQALEELGRQHDAVLQVRLNFSLAPELVDLPWELLRSPGRSRYLAMMDQVSLTRHLDKAVTQAQPAILPPLQVLVVIANPHDQYPLDAAHEWERIHSTFAPLEEQGLAQVTRLPASTLADLGRYVGNNRVNVLHFIGHGYFDAASQEGSLFFEDESGATAPVSGDDLLQQIPTRGDLLLAFLNSCEGARGGQASFAGVAQTLVLGGIPAVVAMQFAITDSAAALFAAEFYRAFAGGTAVDQAMIHARRALAANPRTKQEWATPVLFAPRTLVQLDREPPPPPPPPPVVKKNGRQGVLLWASAAGALLATLLLGLFLWPRLVGGPGAAPPTAPPSPEATVAIDAATPAPTIGEEPTPTAVPAGRPPVTVGLADWEGCTAPVSNEAFGAALEDELRRRELLARRVQLQAIDTPVGDEATARRQADFDIVLWGACDGGDGADATATVTATLRLVGEDLLGAVAHRVAQPDYVALTLPVTQVEELAQGMAAVLAYYGEEEIAQSLDMLTRFDADIAPQVSDRGQRARIAWLVGNAHLEYEHATFLYDSPAGAIVAEAQAYYTQTHELLPETRPYTDVVRAAVEQNLGWLHYRFEAYEPALAAFTRALATGVQLPGALEGAAQARRQLAEGPMEVPAECIQLARLGLRDQSAICRATIALRASDWPQVLALATSVKGDETARAFALFLQAKEACRHQHDSKLAAQGYDRFLQATSMLPRWSTTGWEIQIFEAKSASMLADRCK